MSDKPISNKSGESLKKNSSQSTRRQTLKALTVGGAVAGVSNMPKRWTKPVVDLIILPAHARTTDDSDLLADDQPTTTSEPCAINCDISVDMNWAFSVSPSIPRSQYSFPDLALEVKTPHGTIISPKAAQRGRCLEIKSTRSQRRRIANITPNRVSQGRYELYYSMSGGTSNVFAIINMSATACNNKSYGSIGTGVVSERILFGSISVHGDGTARVRVDN